CLCSWFCPSYLFASRCVPTLTVTRPSRISSPDRLSKQRYGLLFSTRFFLFTDFNGQGKLASCRQVTAQRSRGCCMRELTDGSGSSGIGSRSSQKSSSG